VHAGGDVLFTGRELWVGLSQRTNQEAIAQLRGILGAACPVHTFPMNAAANGPVLHLKSVRARAHSACVHKSVCVCACIRV